MVQDGSAADTVGHLLSVILESKYLLISKVNMDDFVSKWKLLNVGEKAILERI